MIETIEEVTSTDRKMQFPIDSSPPSGVETGINSPFVIVSGHPSGVENRLSSIPLMERDLLTSKVPPPHTLTQQTVIPGYSGGILTTRNSHFTVIFDIQEIGILPTTGLALLSSSQWSSPLDMQREIDVHRIVTKSGVPNFMGCRIPVYSNFNIPRWRYRLMGYPDTQLIDFLEYGWPIGYNSMNWPVASFKNHKGASDFPNEMHKYLEKEVSLGATLGPFKHNPLCTPLCVSPLNSVPKGKDDRRIISDLSFPENMSVNSGIPKDTYLGTTVSLSLPTVDKIAKMIRQKGRNCHIYKQDLSRAYRQIPVDPRDITFLGSALAKHLFIDRVSVMGLRTGALTCQRTTSGVVHVMEKENYDCTNYQDDFIGVETPALSELAFPFLGQLLRELGLIEKESKAVSPRVIAEALGILFNTNDFTMSITPERLLEITRLLSSWLNKHNATRKQLESLIGKLLFVAKCVPPGRIFVGRLLDVLRGLNGRNPTFTVNIEIRKDVRWWAAFMETYNGVSIIPEPSFSKPDSVIATDACLGGAGGVNLLQKQFFHFSFPEFILNERHHINRLELICLVIAVKVWQEYLEGCKLLIRCDNEATVRVVNTGRCRDSVMLSWVRELAYISACCQCTIKCIHIPGSENRLPDLLSRWHLNASIAGQFAQQTSPEWKEVQIPKNLLYYRDIW
jgi:hypothetical protein